MNLGKYVKRTDYSDNTISICAEVSDGSTSIAKKYFEPKSHGIFWSKITESTESVYLRAHAWADEQLALAEKFEHRSDSVTSSSAYSSALEKYETTYSSSDYDSNDNSSASTKSSRFITSAAVGALTGSTIIGGLVGGDFLGGLVGDALEGNDDSLF